MKIKFAKNRYFGGLAIPVSGAVMLVCSAMTASAQDSTSPTPPSAAAPATVAVPDATPEAAAPVQSPPVELSYGVSDILKLSRAKVGEETTIAFIENSRRVYSLSAPEIIYLRREGVSDRVLIAMMDPKRSAEAAKAAVPILPAPSRQPTYPVVSAPQYTTTIAQPSVTYVQSAPTYVPSSTVYVSSPAYVNYGYYPYYYPYYRYPSLSWSVGFGGRGYWGGYRGGVRPWSGVNIHSRGAAFHGGFGRGSGFHGGGPSIHAGGGGFRGGGGGGRHR
jgi:hypothetical protein